MMATLPASDLNRAKAWYSEKLGWEPTMTNEEGSLVYETGSTSFLVYESAFAGTNQATAAGLLVSDFDSTVDELRSKGVTFEDYDFGEDFRTQDGILSMPDGRKSAWFKDSEGNIIGLAEDVGT